MFALALGMAHMRTPLAAGALPLEIYYAVLVVNTFFSIKVFTSIIPPHPIQTILDLSLGALYVVLAFSISLPLVFCVCSALLFVLANVKYMHVSALMPAYRTFLTRKMHLNTMGALLSLASFALAISGYPLIASWALASLFSIANVYLLCIRPMYRLEPTRRA